MKKAFYLMMVGAAVMLLGTFGVVLSGCGSSDEEEEPIVVVDEYDGAFVPGAKDADHGNEVYGYAGPMGIRILANDASKIPGIANDFYFLSGAMANELGILIVNGNTFTAKNFTSNRSGKKYRWMGWQIGKSSAAITTNNPLTLTELSGTLRSHWATVE